MTANPAHAINPMKTIPKIEKTRAMMAGLNPPLVSGAERGVTPWGNVKRSSLVDAELKRTVTSLGEVI